MTSRSDASKEDHNVPLWQLTHQAQVLIAMIGEQELTDDLEQQMDSVAMAIDDKARALAHVRGKLEADLVVSTLWRDRMAKKVSTQERQLAWIESYMARNLGKLDLEVEVNGVSFYGKQTPGRTVVKPGTEAQLPVSCVERVITLKVDLKLVRAIYDAMPEKDRSVMLPNVEVVREWKLKTR